MSNTGSRERVFTSPIDLKWTVSELLDWIGADDARCHDERLDGLLNAVERALGSDADRARSTVFLVRSIVARVLAEPALRDLRLDELCDTSRDRDLRAGAASRVSPAPLLVV